MNSTASNNVIQYWNFSTQAGYKTKNKLRTKSVTLSKLIWLSHALDVMMDNYVTIVQLTREKPGHSNEWTEDWIIKIKRKAMVTCLQPENPNSPTNTKKCTCFSNVKFALLTI
jgi:hypothetical protein